MNSRRIAALAWFVFALSSSFASGGWLPREIAEVRAFVYDYTQEEGNSDLLKGGRLHSGVINKGGAALDKKQVKRLKDALRSTKPREPGAFCYFPHHGFVFYDADGKAMGHIELCFQCGNVKNSPAGLPERQWDWKAIEAILRELDLPILKKDADYTALFEDKKEPAAQP